MIKKLFTQIKNEKFSNLWLAMELLLVSVILWYVVDFLYVNIITYHEPKGFDIEHCYLIKVGTLTEKSPDYLSNWTKDDANVDMAELLKRFQLRPDIEAASLSQYSYPYCVTTSTDVVQYDTLRSLRTYLKVVSPDFVKVFRYKGAQGESPEQLAALLDQGNILASNNLFANYGYELTEFVGKQFCLFDDNNNSYRLGASIRNVRLHEYEQACNAACLLMKQSYYWPDMELCVRVREKMDVDFIERLMADSESQFRVGNLFVADVRSFKDIRRVYLQKWTNDIRNYVMGMNFLLLNIFLGLLGTFWFRTQQRRSEIALHKVHGATSRAVFGRLIAEGICLLFIVTPFAIVIDACLADLGLNAVYNSTTLEWKRLWFCAGIGFVLIVLMICIGVGIPAWQAMKVEPTEALHDE